MPSGPLDKLTGRAPSVNEMIADATFEERENARGAAHEAAVGIAWDLKFGHCFPDLMASEEDPEDDAGAAHVSIVACCCCLFLLKLSSTQHALLWSTVDL
jgi:hypothetical protein